MEGQDEAQSSIRIGSCCRKRSQPCPDQGTSSGDSRALELSPADVILSANRMANNACVD